MYESACCQGRCFCCCFFLLAARFYEAVAGTAGWTIVFSLILPVVLVHLFFVPG